MPPDELETSRDIIESIEAREMKKRTWAMKLADWMTLGFGSIAFLLANGVLFGGWIILNSGLIPGFIPFDPFPFILLTMCVSLEAIFLTIIVLMSQSRQAYIASLRDELELQVQLITERELTKALQLLHDIHQHHNLKEKPDPELDQMLQQTDISYIERKLEEQMNINIHAKLGKAMSKPLLGLTRKASEVFTKSQKQQNSSYYG